MTTPRARDRILDTYYDEVRNRAILSIDEEKALFSRYRSCTNCTYKFQVGELRSHCPLCKTRRNYRARDKLIKGALRFVLKQAKKYAVSAKGHRHSTDVLQCLISAGNLGLLVAVDRFDVEVGTKFLTYAAWWVKEKIYEELDHMGLIRVPVYKQKDLRRKRKLGENTEEDLGHVKVEDLRDVDSRQHDEQLEINLINTYGAELIYQSLQDLNIRQRDKYIVLAYYGVKEEPKTMKQIANRLELSMERIRQIKKQIMLEVKDHLDSKQIIDSSDVFTG